ncbi:MAG: glycosyltransferase [Promethearchaeota archaeon]
MNILVLQETDWIGRGPHPQHHIFERLSRNPNFNITVLDYDIDKTIKSASVLIRKKLMYLEGRTISRAKIKLIRTTHLQVPYLRRITSLISTFFEIIRLMKKRRPNIIVSFSISNGFLGLLFSKLLSIPYVFYSLDIVPELIPFPHLKSFAKILFIFILKNSDRVIATSKLQKRYYMNNGINKKKITCFPQGFSLDNTRVNENKVELLKNELSISNDDFVILFMGYLYDFAGLEEIIDYYHEEVINGKLKLKFLILGDGGIFNQLNRKIEQLRANWVKLIGRVPFFDITEYLYLADLCLLSFSLNDITKQITPIKIIEYMSMKKAVLSTKLPGLVYELDSESGVIFAENQEQLIRKIKDLTKEKEKLKQIGEKSYQYVRERYSWDKILNQFKNIMLEEIKNKFGKKN